MTLSSLQTAANIDVMLFGRSSAAELLDLIDEIKIRQSDNNSWIIHLKHKGQDLSYRVLLSIYSTLNSDPNGLLLGEFDNVYQRLNSRKLIAADYGYKSLWHIFFNYSEMVSMTRTNAGLLLIAEIAPEAPAAPPGFSEPRNGPLMSGAAAQHYISPEQNRASSSTGQTTSYQKKETSLKGQAAVDRPVLTGKEEISLGFRDFQADGEFVIIYIKEIYSPNEFYVWFYKDSPEATEEYKQFFQKLNQFYNVRMNRVKHSLSPPYKKDQLCVYRDEHDRYHRAVVESTINADIVAVRAVDTAEKSQVAPACLFRINDQFRLVKSFTRRCGLCDIRPFNSKTWDDKSRDVFGPKHTDKLYYAKIMFESDQEVELNVIDTHDDEDRHFSDVLVAVGSAENISPTNGVINNAPSTPNDSFTVDDDDEDDDDDWLNDWLADEDTPTIDNSHINISSLHVDNPVPTPQVTNPPQTSNLWDAPLLPNHGGANNSSSEFLKNLMQVNRKR
ncbi:uncharacterized protein LOC134818543 [Bolinopsis microptera]|uniref:uncharacterized protein LOC134818543 n=1 Tax=Bolinopsis microptera TaxID=2820187 RepID=UPI003079144E